MARAFSAALSRPLLCALTGLIAIDKPVAGGMVGGGDRLDLLLGAAAGYAPGKIRHFPESLRRWYDGDAVLVTAQLPAETKDLLREFQIEEFEIQLGGALHEIQVRRYSFYRDILRARPDVERVFLVDVRDLLFQGNPFAMLPDKPLVGYLEEEVIGTCPFNRGWVEAAYGPERALELQSCTISCSGTTGGTRDGILRYLDVMCRELAQVVARATNPGLDQGVHNHLLYGELSCATLVPNRLGAVQNQHYQRQFCFDTQGRMVNMDGQVCPIIHQFDRHPRFFGLLGIDPAAFGG